MKLNLFEKVNFYQLYPLYQEELEFKMKKSLKDLVNKIDEKDLSFIININRKNYCLQQAESAASEKNNDIKISGIYKITDLITEECYIGQSVNIQERMKQHCKCGLGIEASATNKLYNTMQRDKVWNFTFELLEQCSKQLLNEKEKFWIQMYQSDKFGLNTLKGKS